MYVSARPLRERHPVRAVGLPHLSADEFFTPVERPLSVRLSRHLQTPANPMPFLSTIVFLHADQPPTAADAPDLLQLWLSFPLYSLYMSRRAKRQPEVEEEVRRIR